MRTSINVSINDNVEAGDVVCFMTGKRGVNNYPRVIRVGRVIKGSFDGLEVEDLNTGKIWKPYSQDIIKGGTEVKGVQATLSYTERI